MLNALQAVDRIRGGGRLSVDEVAEIRTRIGAADLQDDLHNLVRALALDQQPNAADSQLIAHILHVPHEYAAEGALFALCGYWGLYETCLPDLERFISLDGVPLDWDELMNVACLELGVAYNWTQEAKYLAPLVRQYETETHPFFKRPAAEIPPWKFEWRLKSMLQGMARGLWPVQRFTRSIGMEEFNDVEVYEAAKKALPPPH
jgi:hypothetical protein